MPGTNSSWANVQREARYGKLAVQIPPDPTSGFVTPSTVADAPNVPAGSPSQRVRAKGAVNSTEFELIPSLLTPIFGTVGAGGEPPIPQASNTSEPASDIKTGPSPAIATSNSLFDTVNALKVTKTGFISSSSIRKSEIGPGGAPKGGTTPPTAATFENAPS